MEMILALAVVIAVVVFGALISVGNERQRKAIDGLRDQVVLWAMQDLRNKREKLSREVVVEDPKAWLNGVFTKVVGSNFALELGEAFLEPQALLCYSDKGSRVVFSPHSPATLRRMTHSSRDRLAQNAISNPLFSLPRGSQHFELSLLNSSMLFDLELPIAWKAITGQQIQLTDRFWVYILP